MKSFLLPILIFLTACSLPEVVDRHNYIQKPTETSVTVAWRTAQESEGIIEWGTNKDQLNNRQSLGSGKKHHFTIEGLLPNTKYYYRTNSALNTPGEINHFYTAKPKQVPELTFLHYGDCGTGRPIQAVIGEQMEKEQVDFALVAGDVDQSNGMHYDEFFFQQYRNMLVNTCHYTAIGNHDARPRSGRGKGYLDAFYLPDNNSEKTERYYSFEWGDAKFICLDSNYGFNAPAGTGVNSEKQRDWLEDQLKTNTKKWIFVYFHHPPYTVAWSPDYYVPIPILSPYFRYRGTGQVVSKWMPLFEKYQVDFVLTGHSHCYQRGEHNGVNYIISGGSGTEGGGTHGMDVLMMKTYLNGKRIPRDTLKKAGTPMTDFEVDNQPVKEAYNVKGLLPTIDLFIRQSQYVRFKVTDTQVVLECVNKDGQIIDRVTADPKVRSND